MITAGCRSDKLPRRQTWRLATGAQARCRALTYPKTERSAYLSLLEARSGFPPAPAPPELAAYAPVLEEGGGGVVLMYQKQKLNNLTRLINGTIPISPRGGNMGRIAPDSS